MKNNAEWRMQNAELVYLGASQLKSKSKSKSKSKANCVDFDFGVDVHSPFCILHSPLKKFIGPHVSASGGVHNAPLNARALGATGFGMFVKNQRQWFAKPLGADVIDAFKKNMEECGYDSRMVLVHNSYLINLGSPEASAREKSVGALIGEVERCSDLGLTLLNIHPGSHLKKLSDDECLALIADGINAVLDKTRGVTIVVETTVGSGGHMGGRFEHLASIIDKVEDKTRVGVCLDTCHIFAAGYDIRNKETYDLTMGEFGKVVGFEYIRGLHLNDAMKPLGSRADRHDSIGKGHIGIEPFKMLMQDARFDGIPCVLETIDETIWAKEVEMLKGFVV